MTIHKDKLINADKSRTNQYYLDGHYYQYDLGWIVDTVVDVIDKINNLYELEIVHYADPIQWDITGQYITNTVVVDPQTGTAYISKQPVPTNILLTDTDYWLPIFNYAGEMDNLRSSLGSVFPNNTTTNPVPSGHFVWVGGKLYKATADIPSNTVLRPGVNIVKTVLDDAIDTWSSHELEWNLKNWIVYSEKLTENLTNYERHTSGDDTATAGAYTRTADNYERHTSGGDTATAGDYTRTADNATLSAKHFHIQSTETPLQYGQPDKKYNFYGVLPMTAEDGSTYNVMIEQPNSPKTSPDHVTVVIGDSYSESTQSGTPLWWSYLDATVICHASDGQGFLTGNNKFIDQLTTCKNDVGDRVVDHVYCVGGLNDLGNSAITNFYDFSNAIIAFVRKCRELFPGVPITIGGVPPFQNYNYYSGDACLTDGQRADNFNLFMEYACSNTGVRFVNLRYLGLFTPEFFGSANASKQRHPSAAGEAAIASAMLGSPKYVNGVSYPALIPTVDNNCKIGALTVTERNPNVVCVSFTVTTGSATTAFNIAWNGFPRPPKYLFAYDGVDGCVAGATNYAQGVTNFYTVKSNATYYLYYEVTV